MDKTIKKLQRNIRPHHGRINRNRYKLLRKFITKNDQILDFGCAKGEYVAALTSEGFDVEGIDVLDFQNDWVELGVSEQCSLSNGDVPEGKEFDAVLLFEVLEHIPNPEKFLRQLSPILRDRLLVSVPDCQHHRFLEASGLTFNHFTDTSHVNFFTEEALRKLFESSGFEVLHYERFNPINPILPLLYHLGFPRKLANYFAKFYRLLPRKTYFTQFAVVRPKK